MKNHSIPCLKESMNTSEKKQYLIMRSTICLEPENYSLDSPTFLSWAEIALFPRKVMMNL